MMDIPENFVEEIDFGELNFIEIVGRGAFGVVSRAKWRGIDVAVKHIETASEKKAFITELKQLSRVCHTNIVTLYGACTKSPVCLVMEYAEGGSLYNVLHGSGPVIEYTLAHALSWCLQCAKGVEYLHGMKPKALIHRDLKPPNLLLVQGGTLLKICDFGTACDLHTYMTNNKGSAAWMAPEVFEGSNYSEKCDVFSWGIILWEVLTRRKPFEEIGGPAFRIMWAVHHGTRPPLIANCPKPIETLMTKCWSSNPAERPSMAEIARVMQKICQYVTGAEEALIYPNSPEPPVTSTVYDTPPPTFRSQLTTRIDTHHDTVRAVGEPLHVQRVVSVPKPVVVEDEPLSHQRMTSAPASLAASRESLLDKGSSRSSTPSVEVFNNKRYSADLTKLEQYDIMSQGGSKPPHEESSQSDSELHSGRGHRRTGSHGNSPLTSDMFSVPVCQMGLTHTTTAPGNLTSTYSTSPNQGINPTQAHAHRSMSWTPGIGNQTAPSLSGSALSPENVALNLHFNALDHQLQPLAPCPTSKDSMDIYEEHVNLAKEFMRVQVEIGMLMKRRSELNEELQQDEREQENSSRSIEEYAQLVSENEQLMLLHNNLKKQVEIIRQQQHPSRGRVP